MKLIKSSVNITTEINKSKFIAYLVPVTNSSEVTLELNKIKKEHYNATHHCYAYILDEQKTQKSNDDKEPARTAGMPILETLLAFNLTNVLCVVVRYFGGVKLGKGGLIRAYKNSTLEAIKKAVFYKEEQKQIYQITLNYNQYDAFIHFLKEKALILQEDFKEQIVIKFYLINLSEKELYDQFSFQAKISKLEKTTVSLPL